ncbi:MAG: hypothetical protein ABI318_05080 [Chthoniobacteraceae bacterium]
MPFSKSTFARTPGGRTLRRVLLALAGIAVGALGSHFIPLPKHDAALASEVGTPVRPGPWGELYSVPFTISAPEELLPVRAIESGGTRWFFKGFSLPQLERFLNAAGVPSSLSTALMASTREITGADGVEMAPPVQAVIALPDSARQKIYKRLAQFPENRSSFFHFHKDTLAERMRADSLSEKTIALFQKLSVEHEGYLVLGGLPALLAEIPSPEEKLRLLKSLTRQRTMLLRLRVSKDSDLAALAKYWGKGIFATNARSVLESLAEVPGGTFCGILAILPPIPSAQAYNYPVTLDPQSHSLLLGHDCHWTSLNFFRDTMDPQATDAANFTAELAASYRAVSDDHRFGDVLVMAKPDGEIVHSAILIADDIFFTKNGSTNIYPWMFARLPDLLEQYSFLAPEGQQLTLRYFRNKGM